jgi:hypothetical protein
VISKRRLIFSDSREAVAFNPKIIFLSILNINTITRIKNNIMQNSKIKKFFPNLFKISTKYKMQIVKSSIPDENLPSKASRTPEFTKIRSTVLSLGVITSFGKRKILEKTIEWPSATSH